MCPVHSINIYDNTEDTAQRLAPVAVYRTVSDTTKDATERSSRLLSLSNSRPFTSTVLVARSDDVS